MAEKHSHEVREEHIQEEDMDGMTEEDKNDQVKAGKIGGTLRKKWRKAIKPGLKLLDIAEGIEKEMVEEGASGTAFPVNLSRNREAAHYTPAIGDEAVVSDKDVLKVDIGVQVNGWIADAAFTLDFSGEWGKLLEANELALQNALSVIKPGTELGKVGKEIEDAIKKFGFSPVRNLSGHLLGPYMIHAGVSVPNFDNKDPTIMESGQAYAIEPFATNGIGQVGEGNVVEIYQLMQAKNVRNQDARNILQKVLTTYGTLPFAERWVASGISPLKRKMAFRELLERDVLHAHPILQEAEGKIVSQAETSVLIWDEDVIVLVEP